MTGPVDLDDPVSYSIVAWIASFTGYRWGPPNTNHRTLFPRALAWLEGVA